jgi:hypothetical protein
MILSLAPLPGPSQAAPVGPPQCAWFCVMPPAPIDLPYEASVALTTAMALGYTAALWRSGAGRERGEEAPPWPSPDEVLSAAGFAQNPLDELLGDARFGAGRRHVLVEFKRSRGQIATEIGKRRRAELVRRLRAPDDDTLDRLARIGSGGHLLGFGGEAGGIRFGPYSPLVGQVGVGSTSGAGGARLPAPTVADEGRAIALALPDSQASCTGASG